MIGGAVFVGERLLNPRAHECTVGKPTYVEVRLRKEEPQLDHSYSRDALRAFFKKYGNRQLSHNNRSLFYGLTQSSRQVKIVAQNTFRRTPPWHRPAEVCGQYQVVMADVLYRTIVYIADEAQASRRCYDAVLAHERRHIRVNDAAVDWMVPRLRAALEAHVKETGSLGPVPAGEREKLNQEMARALETIKDEHLQQMEMRALRGNMGIDTPEDSRQMLAACSG